MRLGEYGSVSSLMKSYFESEPKESKQDLLAADTE
jgi:hypothetical protein